MPRIDRYEPLPFEDMSGGVDEGNSPEEAKFTICKNVRDSAGGTSKIKRPGLTKLDSAYDFGTKNIYGCFGIGEIDAVKQLALLEDDIQYKTGGAWGSIFSPSNTIDVPVSVVKDRGLTIVAGYEKPITVLAGSAFYSGIAAPVNLMEVHPEYSSLIEDEDCSDMSDWTEVNGGSGNSSQVSFQSKSCFKMEGSTTGGNPADETKLHKTIGTAPGKRIKIVFSAYFENLHGSAGTDRFTFAFDYTDAKRLMFNMRKGEAHVGAISYGTPLRDLGITFVDDKWYLFELYVDEEDNSIEIYITPDGGSRAYYGTYAITQSAGSAAGYSEFYLNGQSDNTIVYIDYFKVSNTAKPTDAGSVFKYGCTYQRGGNYPCESNPIEAKIHAVKFHGSGLNDLTAGGEFQRRTPMVIVVQIDGTGTPDTIKVSYDAGNKYATETLPLESSMTLQHGITLTWAATTGHTAYNWWIIHCQVASVRKHADEITNITGIPTSSESEVNRRRLWRTYAAYETYYWLYTIGNNTTTSYNDALTDADITGSDAVSYESYPPPEGEDCEIWDGCLWVTRVPSQPEALFKSRTGKLEQFPSPAISFFPLREDETDEVMKVVEFRNNFYPVKVNSIWKITRSGDSYMVDKIVSHTGTAAKGSVAVTDRGIMMLTNHYKIGICDGWKMVLPKISDRVEKTLATINKSYAYRSTSGHDPDNKIYYLSIPTGSNQYPNTTIAFYYEEGNEKFFIDGYHQDITSISLTDVDQYQREILFGTKDGEIYKLDPSATTDDGTLINSKVRTGLIGNERWKRLRRMFLKYYVPSEIIIEDNFNDNNLTGWTTSGGVAASSQRLEVTIENGGADYIRKTFAAKTEIFAYFNLYVSALTTWANGNYIDNFLLGGTVAGVGIRNVSGTTKLRAWYKPDEAVAQDASPDKEIITGSWHRVKVHWKAASAAAANNGIFEVWLDGSRVVNITNCDTDTFAPTQVDLGNGDCSAGVYASLWLDDARISVDKHLTLKVFSNTKEAALIEKNYPGQTPSGGEVELRKLIQRKIKLGIPGNFFSFAFNNNEDVSGFEVMGFTLYARSKGAKRTIKPS